LSQSELNAMDVRADPVDIFDFYTSALNTLNESLIAISGLDIIKGAVIHKRNARSR
jgi:hypothetical protein